MKKESINYTVVDDFDHIVDEKGSMFIALRKIVWDKVHPENIDQAKVRLDLRKWYTTTDGEEKAGKGVSFLTEQGPHNLAKILVENDFGDTKELLFAMKDREDFRHSLNSVLGKDDEFYDPSIPEEDLYIPGNDLFDYEE